jgi:hypothetical protein
LVKAEWEQERKLGEARNEGRGTREEVGGKEDLAEAERGERGGGARGKWRTVPLDEDVCSEY